MHYLFLLCFVTSTIWLPTEWHHPCVQTTVERDGAVGFKQFCTIFLLLLFGVYTVRIFLKMSRKAFEMKGLRRMLQVSWTEKKTNEWVLNKAGVKRELLDTVKARKLAYYGHTMRKQGRCLEK